MEKVHLGPTVRHFQKLGTKIATKMLGDQIETFSKVRGPKLQQKKLGDQIETSANVKGPKVYLSLELICQFLNIFIFI